MIVTIEYSRVPFTFSKESEEWFTITAGNYFVGRIKQPLFDAVYSDHKHPVFMTLLRLWHRAIINKKLKH